jgi:hypothetical protein
MIHALDRFINGVRNSFRGTVWLSDGVDNMACLPYGTGFESRPGTLGGPFAELKSDVEKRGAPPYNSTTQCGFTPI